MKIKSLLAFLALTLLASQAVAKTEEPSLNMKVVAPIVSGKDKIANTEIKTFDFQKIFSEAETYYKSAKAWEKLKCEPKSGFICTKRECPKRDIKAYLILDKKAKTISRCEGEVCESFPAEFKQTGVFFNVQTEGPIGTLVRVLGDSRYKEITTVGLDAYIANGNCEVVQDEVKKEEEKK